MKQRPSGMNIHPGALSADQRGIGLLEAMVALLVLMIGIVAGLVLMLSSTFAARLSRDQLIASNLAREGVEIVRGIRDSNWLKMEAGELNGGVPYKWDDGLWGPAGMFSTLYNAFPSYDYASQSWSLVYTHMTVTFGGVWSVYYDSAQGGFYNQFSAGTIGTLTKYVRNITTYPICSDGVSDTVSAGDCAVGKVKVGVQARATVKWLDNGHTRSVSIEDRIYNWK